MQPVMKRGTSRMQRKLGWFLKRIDGGGDVGSASSWFGKFVLWIAGDSSYEWVFQGVFSVV